jgi:hypothetical protein
MEAAIECVYDCFRFSYQVNAGYHGIRSRERLKETINLTKVPITLEFRDTEPLHFG